MRKGLTAREQARKTTRPNRRVRRAVESVQRDAAPVYAEVFTTTILPAARAQGAATNRSW